ncbi:hypothetical protein HELRODRAFT_167792 [Helobdella robusta]|uniref:Major facilitator superfamily (MFS) profile domain-containing protein n=1 Tax=Helobdella robusta TaxID=6412 RepID=T1EZT4_HELRO|nr:hypothetical protein HELRODRAFT_167792 [Helobdella robusta]ESO09960.1 hypothetical protein HELRODRAFT_167792 [Helobdella robusta]
MDSINGDRQFEQTSNVSVYTKIIVALASTFCNFLIQCIFYSSLTVIKEFQEERNSEENEDVQLTIAGLMYSIFLKEENNHRFTIVGSILTASSLFLSSFQTNQTEFITIFCVLTGFGLGAIYISSLKALLIVFKNNCKLMLAFVIAASEISFFVFDLILSKLILHYGWNGTNQLLAAIVLNCLICGYFFKVETRKETMVSLKEQSSLKSYDSADSCDYDEAVPPSYIMQKIIDDKDRQQFDSSGSLDGYIITNDNEIIPPPFQRTTSKNSIGYSSCASHFDVENSEMKSTVDAFNVYLQKNVDPAKKFVHYKYGNKVLRLTYNMEYKSFTVLNGENRKGLYPSMIFMTTYFLNEDMTFSQTVTIVKFMIAMKILVKLPLGILSSIPKLYGLTLYSVLLLMLSIVLFVLPWLTTFNAFIIHAMVMGSIIVSNRAKFVNIGAQTLLKLYLLIDMYGPDNFVPALGLLSFFEGISSFIGPLLSKLLDEKIENFIEIFSTAAGLILFSSLISLLLRQKPHPCLKCK